MLKQPDACQLHRPELAQPICTALQIGLVNELRRSGVELAAVIGHSSGEIAAAYACGVLSVEAALIVAFYRGFVTKGQDRAGGMAAVALAPEDVSEFLSEEVVIACENSWESTTISGDSAALENALDRIKAERPGTLIRKLQTGMAYHSRKSPFPEAGCLSKDIVLRLYDTVCCSISAFDGGGISHQSFDIE